MSHSENMVGTSLELKIISLHKAVPQEIPEGGGF